ncbi:hypothetical protein SHD_0248 [Shewanella decolorationis S12]|jgi:hypothetical protein|uniref:Uncharacterized protein n=1 Tax=Shewanella decolorationis S12 TaxID=1353536 RepID=A0ABP2ZCG7_9GAMM|nr:hypothetical protein SHD_0248 [Shewanella decolorationis S12]
MSRFTHVGERKEDVAAGFEVAEAFTIASIENSAVPMFVRHDIKLL